MKIKRFNEIFSEYTDGDYIRIKKGEILKILGTKTKYNIWKKNVQFTTKNADGKKIEIHIY